MTNIVTLNSGDCPQLREAQRRHNRTHGRSCDSCEEGIATARDERMGRAPENSSLYWRVLRHDDRVEFFHDPCFREEFGWHSEPIRLNA